MFDCLYSIDSVNGGVRTAVACSARSRGMGQVVEPWPALGWGFRRTWPWTTASVQRMPVYAEKRTPHCDVFQLGGWAASVAGLATNASEVSEGKRGSERSGVVHDGIRQIATVIIQKTKSEPGRWVQRGLGKQVARCESREARNQKAKTRGKEGTVRGRNEVRSKCVKVRCCCPDGYSEVDVRWAADRRYWQWVLVVGLVAGGTDKNFRVFGSLKELEN